VIETNIREGRAGKKAQPRRAAQEQQQIDDTYEEEHKHGGGVEEPKWQCNFCLRVDPSFNEESLDIHYWKECPMLTTCWECDQVIEIAQIEDHLLEECPQMGKYKFCQKCKSVLLKEEFNGHDCIAPNPVGAARCPLCTENIFPADKDGWYKHVMEHKCPGNPRLPR